MILLTGKGGQLASELEKLLTDKSIPFRAFSKNEWDITNNEQGEAIIREYSPTIIINCAAYNAVDKAEDQKQLADSVNHIGPKILAELSSTYSIFLVHISTDFVFGASSQTGRPLTPQDKPDPQSNYAKSKYAGEQAIRNVLTKNQYTIIRTSWVFSEYGANFVKTILRLASDLSKNELRIVEDQVGRPTSAKLLAIFIQKLLQVREEKINIQPLYHFSNSGIASWYDFAHEIVRQAYDIGILTRKPIIKPIPTEAYPLPAQRPTYSVMNIEDARCHMDIPHWRESLVETLLVIHRNTSQ